MRDNQVLLNAVRDWIARERFPEDGRLPPERKLAERLGMTRAELRKVLMVLEAEGRVWRHVGKGTFLARDRAFAGPDVESIADRTSPPEAMAVRFILEPDIASMAAMHASARQVAELRQLCLDIRRVTTWDEYENLDWRFHELLAQATGNNLLVEIQHVVNGVRRAVVWGRLSRRPTGPSPDYHSFDEHDAILDAIARRDRRGAADAMRRHLTATASAMTDDSE